MFKLVRYSYTGINDLDHQCSWSLSRGREIRLISGGNILVNWSQRWLKTSLVLLLLHLTEKGKLISLIWRMNALPSWKVYVIWLVRLERSSQLFYSGRVLTTIYDAGLNVDIIRVLMRYNDIIFPVKVRTFLTYSLGLYMMTLFSTSWSISFIISDEPTLWVFLDALTFSSTLVLKQ